VISIFAHVFFFKSNLIHSVVIVFGLWTSLINHGSTNFFFKKLDRCAMVLGFLCDMYFLRIKYHVVCAGLAYYGSKLFAQREFFHLTAHALVTWGHVFGVK